jgi:putative SOS response-associated peptidase YedK
MTLAEPDWETIRAMLEAELDPEAAAAHRPRYNVAPTQPHPIALVAADGKRRLVPATWGFAPVEGRPLINARAETLDSRPTFANARRCVVPADGFYEWREQQPYWFHASDGKLLLFAGLCEPGPNGPRFVVITTAANAVVAPAHDRMPALLAPSCVAEWLARPAGELLLPAPDAALVAHPVSDRVNGADRDEPSLLAEVRPRHQLSLF